MSFEQPFVCPIEPGSDTERLKTEERLESGKRTVRGIFGDQVEVVLGKIARGEELSKEEKDRMQKVREKSGFTNQ